MFPPTSCPSPRGDHAVARQLLLQPSTTTPAEHDKARPKQSGAVGEAVSQRLRPSPVVLVAAIPVLRRLLSEQPGPELARTLSAGPSVAAAVAEMRWVRTRPSHFIHGCNDHETRAAGQVRGTGLRAHTRGPSNRA